MSKKGRENKLLARIKAKSQKRPRRRPAAFPPHVQIAPAAVQPAFADIDAPAGFRPIAAMQAIMTFAGPLHEYLGETDDVEAANAVMQLGVAIWNYTLPKVLEKPSKAELIDQIADTLDLDEQEAADLFDRMMERKAYLFPDDIQPDDVRLMFMRKEVDYLIAPYAEAQMNLAESPIPPDTKDQTMLAQLQKLDHAINADAEYDTWEHLYFDVEKACCDRYHAWLTAKGAPQKQRETFPFCLEIFLNFVYRYNAISVLNIADIDLEEFFLNFLPRKVQIEPCDYVFWPPALRLFYRFLHEKGYLDDPEPLIELFHAIEPDFIDMLKKQF